MAAAILEVMGGARSASGACEELGISAMKYYALEDRALQGMVAALEPRSRGRRAVSPQDAALKAERERELMRRELGRAQALLRLVRKSVKLNDPREGKKGRRGHHKPAAPPQALLERLRAPKAAAGAAP